MLNTKLIYGRKSFRDKEQIFVKEEDFEIPHGEDYNVAVKYLENILINNNYLLKSFRYNDLSLWWLLYQSLIPKFKKSINFIIKFSEMLDELNPKIVIIKDDFSRFDLIRQICINKKIDFTYSKKLYLKFILFNKTKNYVQKNRYAKILKIKTSTRKKIFLKSNRNIPSISNKFLFAIPTNFRRQIFDVNNSRTVEGEYIQQSIFNLLPNDQIVAMDLDYTFKGEFNVLSSRLDDDISWFPMETIILDELNIGKIDTFLHSYKKLINKKSFQNLFIFDNILLWESLKQYFNEMLYAPNFPFYLKLIESLKIFLKDNEPKCIFLPYETGSFALAIISICKNLRIKTIGIQHGYIYENNPMYVFGKFTYEKQKLGFPIPDHTLLFGNYVKNLLIKNGYPSKNFTVIGNPAFFNFHTISASLDSSHMKLILGINNFPKIILFTSGKLQRNYPEHGKYDYDEQIWKTLLEHFGSNSDYYLILKPHPQEKNIDVYQNMIKKSNCKNATVSNNSIYELINLSSIVISVFSSTMLDSIVFQKPVMRVKFENEFHPIFDPSEGIFTTTLDQLEENINKILSSENVQKSLISKGRDLLLNHYGIPENDPKSILQKILLD